MEELREKVRSLPDLPGTYLMKDSKGHVIYVGKAISLKKRVSSYFQKTSGQSPKTLSLVSHISDIDFIVTSTEVEALILENNLIKKHRPRYNVILRDDKSYPYLRLSSDEYPKITVVRRIKNDGAEYFGPYTSATSMRDTIRLIGKAFPLRTCSEAILRNRSRPCLNYQIGRCIAPCAGHADRKVYDEIVQGVRMFLGGKNKELLKTLDAEMKEAADRLEFEKAARLRDRITSVRNVLEKQNISFGKISEIDFISVVVSGEEAQVAVFFVRGGAVIGSKTFPFSRTGGADDGTILGLFISQFYAGDKFIPDEIVVPCDFDDRGLLERWLSERRKRSVKITPASRGERVRVLEMARRNAEIAMKERLERLMSDDLLITRAKEELGLVNLPRRIECFDISNIGGKEAVASMVVFQDGRPCKESYRRFRIKTVEGSNDYGMMAEVLFRRYGRVISEGGTLPDLVMVDGGKGQLNILLEVSRELDMKGVDMVSIAKERGTEKDRIFIPKVKEPVRFPTDSPVIHLFQHVRDESHRFAVSYHKKLREKGIKRTSLLEIPGIGRLKASALLRHIGSLEDVKGATMETLLSVPGLTKKDAEEVYRHFHGNNTAREGSQ